MRVPAKINKVFKVVEYCHLASPVLVSAPLAPQHLIRPVQNVAICSIEGGPKYVTVFCTENWQQLPSGPILTTEQWNSLTLEEAKELAREALNQQATNWHAMQEVSATGFHENKIAQPNSVEALAWLQSADDVFRTFGGNGIRKGYAGKRAEDYIKRLYRRGAVRVTAIEVQRDRAEWVRLVSAAHSLPETEVFEATDELIVELPADPQARAELLKQWVSTFGRQKWDVPADTEQKYLYFRWD